MVPGVRGVGAENRQAWIEQLGSDRFTERELATRRLVEVGRPAIPDVVDAVGHRDPEIRTRSVVVLQQLAQFPDQATRLAARRALEKLASSPDRPGGRTALRTATIRRSGGSSIGESGSTP